MWVKEVKVVVSAQTTGFCTRAHVSADRQHCDLKLTAQKTAQLQYARTSTARQPTSPDCELPADRRRLTINCRRCITILPSDVASDGEKWVPKCDPCVDPTTEVQHFSLRSLPSVRMHCGRCTKNTMGCTWPATVFKSDPLCLSINHQMTSIVNRRKLAKSAFFMVLSLIKSRKGEELNPERASWLREARRRQAMYLALLDWDSRGGTKVEGVPLTVFAVKRRWLQFGL